MGTLSKLEKVLFVCTEGKIRSVTAASMVSKRFELDCKSCGTSPEAKQRVTGELLDWADLIVVFGSTNRGKIRRKYKGYSHKMIQWNIEDIYYPFEPELEANILSYWLYGRPAETRNSLW